jgi:hypothetical protein
MEVSMRAHVQLRRRIIAAAAIALCIGLSPEPAAAHHGWGGYLDATTDISGTVEKAVSLAGPHATMKIKADGHVWDVVLAPPNRTEQAGLKEGIIPVGAQVTVHGNRSRDNNKFEIKTTRVTWKDRVFNVYPDKN